jgi:hypothetical protein
MTDKELDMLMEIMSKLKDKCVDIDCVTWGVENGQLCLYPNDSNGRAHSRTMALRFRSLDLSDSFIEDVERVINSLNVIARLSYICING